MEPARAPTAVDTDASPDGRRRIRVLWLIKGLGRGGAELLLCRAAAVRDRRSIEYEAAYLLASRGWLADDLRSEGVPVHLFPAANEFDLRWARRLRRFLIEHPVDVVHVHSPLVAGVARLVLRTIPPEVRPRMVSTEHVPWSGYVIPTRILNAITFGLDDAHLAVSEGVRASIPRRWRSSVRPLIHGVPLAHVREQRTKRDAVRARIGVGPDEVLVGTVANFRAQKAYPDLLAAAKMVLERGRSVRFAALGQGPLENEIRALRDRLGLERDFLLLGQWEDAAPFLAACDLLALSSLYEGLPLAVMEALTLGVPVVSTAVEGVTELIREGTDGILVPRKRPDLLADALDGLILDADRRAAMSRAAAAGAERFDNRVAVRAIEELYRSLVAARPNYVRDESYDATVKE